MEQEKVIIYSFKHCPYCIKAKNLLDKQHIKYKEIEVTNEELEQLKEKTNMTTVPQIFVGNELIGGFDDLLALYNNKKKFAGVFQKKW